MNVLVITDNTYLWREFQMITTDLCLEGVRFDYACSESSLSLFGGEKNAPAIIKVKKDYSEIIRNYELVISMHCKQLFPRKMVEHVRCINVHPGLNPYNRGWFPQVFAILNKLPHGATIHEIDAELDHGRIIAQETVPIYEWDTSLTIYNRVQSSELSLIRANLASIIQNTYQAYAPSIEGNINYKKDYNSLCQLEMDQQLSMRQAIDLLRALTHEPYSNAFFIAETGEKIFVKIHLEKEGG